MRSGRHTAYGDTRMPGSTVAKNTFKNTFMCVVGLTAAACTQDASTPSTQAPGNSIPVVGAPVAGTSPGSAVSTAGAMSLATPGSGSAAPATGSATPTRGNAPPPSVTTAGAGMGGGLATAGRSGAPRTGGTGLPASTGAPGAAGTTGTTGGQVGSAPPPSADAVPSSGCGSNMPPNNGTYTINVDGTDRTYILRVPDNYDANRPYRLILSYHPLGGTAEFVERTNYYGIWSMANGSTIFAAPQGIDNGWSDTGTTRSAGGQDIKLTQALVTELTGKLCVDTSRIFAEGFSMGGSMAYAIACAMGDVVRGVVAHSGGPMSGCVQHNKPVAYFMTHGTEDSVCKYPTFGVPQLNDFAKVNGCMAQTLPTPSGTTPACVDFQGCMPGYPTRACIFVGDHTPSPAGNWVPKESWTFISQF